MIAMHHAIYGRRYGETITFTATSCTTFNMTIRYTGTITVDWGNGTTTTQTSSNASLNFNKTYGSAFTGIVTITGDLGGVTEFTSLSNTGISLDVKELKKFSILNYLRLQGNIVVNNTILDLPRVTNTLYFLNVPNLTLTGNVIDLPRVTNALFLSILPNLTLTGSVSDLPRVTNTLYLSKLPNLTLTGSVSDLPRVTDTLYLRESPNVTLTGSASDLPRVTNTLYFLNLPNLTLTGNAIDLPRVTNQVYLENLPNLTLTGNVIDLPRVTNTLYISASPNVTLTGNASDLPLSIEIFISSIGITSLSYTGGTTKPTTKSRTRIEISTKFTTAQTDAMLIDYATYSTTWNSPRQIYLSSLGRTSASDSAVATLTSRSVTITLV